MPQIISRVPLLLPSFLPITHKQYKPCIGSSRKHCSNPYPPDLAHAHIIVAPVVETGGFRVGVPGHTLRDLDAPGRKEPWLAA